ncbi:MAG: flippase-like domain-containing protein [Candidatus Sumerlaeia bacterium]|nr:flippase-like domain-containing protein [Candidatus Sumerlaeia bacterium]
MRGFLLRGVLPALVTGGLLYVCYRLIEEPEKIPGHIAAVPWHIHAAFIVISLVSMWCRAIRWRALLPGHGLTSHQCFGPLMIGFMMNSLLPARAGEFARCVALAQKAPIPFTKAFGSVLLERIFDGVVLLASLAVVLFLLGATLPTEVTFGQWTLRAAEMQLAVKSSAVLVLVVLAGIVVTLIPVTRRLMERVLAGVLPAKLSRPLITQLEHLIGGFHSLRSPLAVLAILFWTVAVWATVALSVWVMAWGFPELSEMSFAQAWAVVVFVCVAILLPASPGYWGLYEIGVIASLLTLGLIADGQKGIAFAYSVVIHVWQIIPNLIIGLYYLWADGLRLGQLRRAPAAPPGPVSPCTPPARD